MSKQINLDRILYEVGERIKTVFYLEFEELIPSVMADKIDEIIKEATAEFTEQVKATEA